MHLPELPLRSRAFCSLRSRQGVRVDFLQREVAIDEAHAVREALEQQFHRGGRLLAIRALEIAVLDDGDSGMLRSQDVVSRANGIGQFELVMLIHDSLPGLFRECTRAPGQNRNSSESSSATGPKALAIVENIRFAAPATPFAARNSRLTRR